MPDEHLSDQFRVEHQGPSPLRYHRSAHVERYGVVNPAATLPDEPRRALHTNEEHIAETEYWKPKAIVGYGRNDRKLKQPKEITNPSAAAPGTVSFADVTPQGEGGAYIHFVNTRQDQKGQGHASRLVEHVAQQYPGTIHFGKVMSPSIWRMKESLEQQGRQTLGHRDF